MWQEYFPSGLTEIICRKLNNRAEVTNLVPRAFQPTVGVEKPGRQRYVQKS